MRIKRILVPIDFSEASDAALAEARDLAVTLGASVRIVHVFDDPYVTGAMSADGQMFLSPDLRAALMADAEARLRERLQASVSSGLGEETALLTGPVAASIVEYHSRARRGSDPDGHAREGRHGAPAARQRGRARGAYGAVSGAHASATADPRACPRDPSWRHGSGLTQPELLHPVPHLIPVQPEQFGRPCLVVAGALERLNDELPLDVLQIHAFGGQRELGGRRRCASAW